MPHRSHSALAPLLVAALASVVVSARQRDIISPQWIEQSTLPAHHHSVNIEGGQSIDVTIASAANESTVARLADTTTRTLRVMSEWLGPLTASRLTVVDLPWSVDAPGASYPGLVATRMRLIAPVTDVAAERSLITGLARQFWIGAGEGRDAAFQEGLTLYTSLKAIHRVLEGRNFEAPRFIGGFVPFTIRSVVLSPNMAGAGAQVGEFDEILQPAEAAWRFDRVTAGAPALRALVALRTLERVIGWPAMQQALTAVRRAGAITPEGFAAALTEQRGVSMAWFSRDLVRSSDIIDYAVGTVTSEQSDGGIRTRVQVERRGGGTFSLTDRPRAEGPVRSITVAARFEDGSEALAYVDGRDTESTVTVDSASPVIAVAIDPGNVVLMDVNRSNNRWTSAAPANRLANRLVANWVIWLQNVMLTCTAIA